MTNLEFEAKLLAAVHLYHRIENKDDPLELPGLSEICFDEFHEFIGAYHALVEHYEDALKSMKSAY